nr:uncharacterized protein LOC127339213 [Lolium perenne]
MASPAHSNLSKASAPMVPSFLFLVFIWVLWIPLMLAEAQEQLTESCSGSDGRCGNLTISHPFWLVDADTGRSCGSGSLDFEVVCYNNTPVLRSSGLDGFAIINITYGEHSLRAIDLGKQNLLRVSNSCDILPSRNTSTKLGRPFQISNNNLNLILYNCTEAPRGLVETNMGCGNQHKVFVGAVGSYDEKSDNASYAIKGCKACVLPVLGSSGKVNASDYAQLINDGFLMSWENTPPPLGLFNQSYNETSDYGGYAVEGCDTCVVPVLGANGEANARNYERLISDGFLLTWDGSPLAQLSSRGNFTIADPFWLVDLKTGRSCGPQEFGLVCYNNNTPVLRGTEILGFAIIQMNYAYRSLRAIDLDKLNLLNGSNRCKSFPRTWNTSTKLGHRFRISNMNQNLILYNCTTEAAAARRADRELVETGLRCGNQSDILVGAGGRYNETSDYGSYALEGCDASVMPVLGSSSRVANASDYEKLIRDGFLLTWDDAPPLASKFAHPIKSSFNQVAS